MCLLMPMSARADSSASDPVSRVPSVSIELPPSADQSPDGWDKPPLIAQLIPQGPGIILYRFGAAPGPWQRCWGPVVIPPGKQIMSVVLIAPDGTPGNVTTMIARSDIHAEPLASAAATSVSQATYTGTPSTSGVVSVSVLVGRQLGTIVRRLGGSDRYDTSAIISSSVPTHGNTVIIATGEKFPDALTASGLAGCLDAPVLLVARSSIPPKTSAEIRRLNAHHAIICGGTPSVSSGVETSLRRMGLSVERLAGSTRYETAVAVSQRIQKLSGSHDHVYIARGDQFADALIVSPLAYTMHSPILLSETPRLRDSTAARLIAAHYRSATIIGSGLSSRAEQGIRHRIVSVDRCAGAGPSDTSVQVAAEAVLGGALSWKYIGVARSDIFPDALCGGALAGEQGGVILLTPSTTLDSSVANALTAHTADVKRCEIYGGTNAISAAVFDQIRAIFH
jgi:putative cell wall-binding protein